MGPLILLFWTSGNVSPGFKARVDPSLACFVTCMQWIPEIHLWCNTCWLYGGQHGSWAFSIHVPADVSASIQIIDDHLDGMRLIFIYIQFWGKLVPLRLPTPLACRKFSICRNLIVSSYFFYEPHPLSTYLTFWNFFVISPPPPPNKTDLWKLLRRTPSPQ